MRPNHSNAATTAWSSNPGNPVPPGHTCLCFGRYRFGRTLKSGRIHDGVSVPISAPKFLPRGVGSCVSGGCRLPSLRSGRGPERMIKVIIAYLLKFFRWMQIRNDCFRPGSNGSVYPADADSTGAGCSTTAVTTKIPRLRGTASERTWIASSGEAQWDACGQHVSPCAASATADCGHTARGPHERRNGYDSPEQGNRSVCGPCLHAIEYIPPRTTPRRHVVRKQPQLPERARVPATHPR